MKTMFSKWAMLALLFTLYAQDSFSQVVVKLPDSSLITLREVVVSANKTPEPKDRIAQQVQVLNSLEIANLQAQTTAEVLAKAGVQVQMSQQGGGSPTLRGFEASRILLVIDGVRMNNLIYRAGHLQDIIKTDNNILDRMEVVYGPASTVYGSDALGGVIHLYTKKPILGRVGEKPAFKVNFLSRYGSVNNEYSNHLDVNYGTAKFGSLTSLTYSDFGDLMGGKNQNPFYNGSYGERPFYAARINGKDSLMRNSNRYLQVGSAYTQYDLMQKFLYKQNDHITHGLNLQYSNSSNVPRYDRLTDPTSTGLRFAEWYYGPQTRLLAAYDMNYSKMDEKQRQNEVHVGINYQGITESRHNRNFGSDFRSNRIEKVGVLGANIDVQRRTWEHHTRFGLDMQLNGLTSTANRENIVDGTTSRLDTRYPDGDNSMNNIALYLSHTWVANEAFIIAGGARGGYSMLRSTIQDVETQFNLPYTEIQQNAPLYSGNLSLIHKASDDVKLTAMVATGYRIPNVDDLSKIFGSAPGRVIVPNTNLKPEQTINYEIGITKIFNQKTIWENSIYYTDYRNIGVVDVFQFNGQDSIMYDGAMSRVYANQNKDKAFIYGMSSTLYAKFDQHFHMGLNLNYTYGRILTDSINIPLDHIPPFMARINFSYNRNRYSSDFFINYAGAKKLKDYSNNGEDNLQYATPEGMPAWFTVNFRASYKVYKGIAIQAGVDNLFDTQYRTFASGINAPGRNVFVALRGSF